MNTQTTEGWTINTQITKSWTMNTNNGALNHEKSLINNHWEAMNNVNFWNKNSPLYNNMFALFIFTD